MQISFEVEVKESKIILKKQFWEKLKKQSKKIVNRMFHFISDMIFLPKLFTSSRYFAPKNNFVFLRNAKTAWIL